MIQSVGPELKPQYGQKKKEEEAVLAGHQWWLSPVILATQEAESRRVVV
jgi:hypothetical protein